MKELEEEKENHTIKNSPPSLKSKRKSKEKAKFKGKEKKVRFATKLDNNESLDIETRERIEHNLMYNDETIFENMSIFREISAPHYKQEMHPSKLEKGGGSLNL